MFKIALCQTKVYIDKNKNLENAIEKIRECARNGAKIISLPEMFNCPYAGENFKIYSEEESNSQTLEALKKICNEEKIYLVAGSIPEIMMGKVYNTLYVIDPRGNIIGKYRKSHLFDINLEKGIKFLESDNITRGDEIKVIETEYCKIGLCICYDIRFPELVRNMTLQGAEVIFAPAAFSSSTGPAHWELLLRSRALDNQVYMAGISPSRDCEGTYKPYANSLVVNPWGEIVARAKEEEEIVYCDIDLEFLKKIRNELPVLKHRRPEIY